MQRLVRNSIFGLLLAMLLSACSGEQPGSSSVLSGGDAEPGRVVMIGVDGADWSVIRPLMARGMLPAFSRLADEGATGVLMSMEPSASPALWTTIATGVSPESHGIRGFVVANPEGGGIKPVTSTMRRAPAFWNILPQFERRAAVVGWLVTWPAEQVDGVIVSTYLPYVFNWSTGRPLKGTIVDGLPHQTHPADLIDTLQALKVAPGDLDPALLKRFYEPDLIAGLSEDSRECVEGFRWSVACDETYRRIGMKIYEDHPVDLFAVYFGGVDVASHRFWKFANPDTLPYGVIKGEASVLRKVIDAYYVHIDSVIGDYLDRLGPHDTLMVLSDHGFQPVLIPGHPTTSGHHRPEGVIALVGRGIRKRATIEGARLLDVLPTVLTLLGVPLSRDLEGKVLDGMFEPGFAADHPPSFVDHYDDAARPAAPDASGVDPNVLERLRSLGYID